MAKAVVKPKSKKIGRPSGYKPEFCDIAVEFLKDGYSVTALAGHLHCARSSVFKWAEENEAFSDALKTGQALAALWWENKLREVASTGVGSASAAIFGVKNRSRDEWKEHHNLSIDDMPSPFELFEQAARAAGNPGWNTALTKPDPEEEKS